MKLFLAPIQGMTIACYREAFADIFGGIDAYYTPFITTSSTRKAASVLSKEFSAEHANVEVKVIPQLLSNDGDDFRNYSHALADLGYNEINWNIGCPFPMVTNKKKGSGILPYPDMIRKILDVVCSDNSYKITAKMRLGLDEPEEGMRVIRVLNEYPLGGVIIHARTGSQMYTGKVDLDSFETLALACKHEVTYNGDIFTQDDFMRISTRFPHIESFMLGRGALKDPFLPSAIKGQMIPADKKISMIRSFHDDIFSYYKMNVPGEKHLCDRMKEFWDYMSIHTVSDGKLLKKIKKCHSSADYLDAVNHILCPASAWSDLPLR